MIRWWLSTRRIHLGLGLDDVAHLAQLPLVKLRAWAEGGATPADEELQALAHVLADPAHPPGAWPLPNPVEVGAAAFCLGSPLGIGRVVALDEQVVIEHFLSPGHTTQATAPAAAVVRASASPQTRCYVESGGAWRAGRVGQTIDDTVEVHFPEWESSYLSEATVRFRSATPLSDPTEVLAAKAHETAFFYRTRAPFARAVLRSRETATLAGLASAAVHLYPHQVGVVRRVLEDPVRRYLLADEVGLGKTIEAGAIIRQTLLDEPDARILVLVPAVLAGQWREELDRRFDAFARPGRVAVQSIDAPLPDGSFDLVVVDEAHHLADVAWSAHPEPYQRVAALAHATPGLLLLSATPAFHNEEAFLAMLHLLDPVRYRLGEIEAFRKRVASRVEVGRALLGLSVSSSAIARKLNLRKVRAYFESDAALQALADHVENATGEDSDAAVVRLRDYISETHRIYRRMLRTRRVLATDALGVNRGDAARALRAEFSIDERLTTIDGELDVWRGRALAASPDSAVEAAYARAFRVLVETAGADLDLFAQVAEARAGLAPLPGDLTVEDAAALLAPPLFDGEREALAALVETAREPTEETRMDLLAMLLDNEKERAVVFVSYPGVARHVAAALTDHLGLDTVELVSEGAQDLAVDAVRRFRDDPDCRVLVCDRSGEEGLNLQHAGLLIHYDTPLRPNRIEQRTGRLDRIGRSAPMRTRVLLDPEPVTQADPTSTWQAWYTLLREGFGVFDQSIADLQFFVQQIMEEVTGDLLRAGGTGLIERVASLREKAEAERVGLAAQDALDAVDTAGGLQASDLTEDALTFQKTIVPWVCDALQFQQVAAEGGGVRFRHHQGQGIQTLVPADLIFNRFLPAARRPLSFDRDEAVASERALPLRAGHPLFDALAAYAAWDDRGRAFAVARTAPTGSSYQGGLTAAFQFDLVVEPDLDHRDEDVSLHALQRRSDGFLPPRTETIYVHPDGHVLTDPELLAILGRSFKSRKEGGGDINLHKDRLHGLDMVIPPSQWAARCREAREVAVSHLTNTPAYQGKVDRAAQYAARATEGARRAADLWNAEEGITQSLDAELATARAVEAAVAHPRVRVDAVGFWVVQ